MQSEEKNRQSLQLLESFSKAAYEELDRAKVLFLGKYKIYPEDFKESRLRILAIITFLIPLTLGLRDFSELVFLRPYLLIIVIGLIGFGIIIFFIYESKKKTVNNLLYTIESGYNIAGFRINSIRGFIMGLSFKSQPNQSIDFLFVLASLIAIFRMELSDAIKAASRSDLFSKTHRKELVEFANVLDNIMRKSYLDLYMPNESEITKFCDQVKVEIPWIAQALSLFQQRYGSTLSEPKSVRGSSS